MKSRAFVGSLVILAAFCCGGQAQSASRNISRKIFCTVPKEEVRIFIAYESLSREPTVVVTQTQATPVDIDSYNLQLAAQGYGIPPDFRADFKKKNTSACTIRPFTGVPNLRFISGAEEKRIFRKGINGWHEFHRRYGKNTSIDELSRVGFNSDKTLALLHVSSGISSGGVAGTLYLLERMNDKWVIKWQIETWGV